MKRFVTTAIAMSLLFTACSSTAFSIVKPEVTYANVGDSDTTPGAFGSNLDPEEHQAAIAREAAEEAKRQRELKARQEAVRNTFEMQSALKRLKTTVGKTPYVFAGSTPSGWDCSGLVRWTYQQVGVTLYHGATSQMRSGKVVKDPLPGDLVAFVHGKWSRSTGHVGIYIGDGKVLHSQKPGTRTRIESAEHGSLNRGGLKTIYIRIIPMLPESDLPQKPDHTVSPITLPEDRIGAF